MFGVVLKVPLLDTAEIGAYDFEVRIFTILNLPEMTFKISLINLYGIRIMRFGKVFLLS
jgi:hypothetical protein